ncbi:hypothetical protein [uncultured Eudoraea sp.]|uniref:hypothetical protein n=1 Tax=uncultured Eudoraea sp. TaxID=1035614 RepID=UPI002622FCBB|nr:hypothetical protein [uncultured Eudoraea sp.]
MADQQTTKETTSNDEIDLGQLFRMIGNGFNRLFRWFLRIFLYFKKNFLVLLSLVIVGALIAFGLNQFVSEKLQTEVIVKPNFESKAYLYDAVDEIQANIKGKDTIFFSRIGISLPNLKGYEVAIDQTLKDIDSDNDNLEYLELLEKFQDGGLVTAVTRTEILNKSSLEHKITFTYKDAANGRKFSQKVMEYINSNSYFKELTQISQENALERIRQNEALLVQMDELISRYSDRMASTESQLNDQRIILDNEKQLDIAELFNLKNSLIRDIERKKMELLERKDAISIIYFGEPHIVQKSFFGEKIILIPLILLAIFFFIDILKYLNKKAAEVQN